MRRPIDPTVAELVDRLDEDLAEMFQERAAVREYDGTYTRAHAEALALLDVVNRHPDALSGVTVFAFELDGATHWIVTTDRMYARKHGSGDRAMDVRRADLAKVIDEKYFGIAGLVEIDR